MKETGLKKIKIGIILNLTIFSIMFVIFVGMLCYFFSLDIVTLIQSMEKFGISNIMSIMLLMVFLGLMSGLNFIMIIFSILILLHVLKINKSNKLEIYLPIITTYNICCYTACWSTCFLNLIGTIVIHTAQKQTKDKKEKFSKKSNLEEMKIESLDSCDRISILKKRLKKLEQMKQDGLISEDQYKEARAKFINKSLE